MRKPITLLSLFVFLFFSCNTEGHRGVSKSIVESKKRKSFLFSYEIFIPNQVKVDSLDIDEVFVEESWFVGKSDNTRDSEFLSLVIVEGGGNTFFKKYTVGNLTYTNDNILVYRFDKSQLNDTLELPISYRDSGVKLDSGVYFIKKVDSL
jgi:hypothetical protein